MDSYLEDLKKQIHKHNFQKNTQTKVSYEYIIFDKFNDELHDAHELYEFSKHIPCKVNIIEYNPIDKGSFIQAKPEKVEAFKFLS